MKTYKQKYYELVHDFEEQGRYKLLYFNLANELDKLRTIAEALNNEDLNIVSVHLEEWNQFYK